MILMGNKISSELKKIKKQILSIFEQFEKDKHITYQTTLLPKLLDDLLKYNNIGNIDIIFQFVCRYSKQLDLENYVQLLINVGVNLDLQDNNKYTVLMLVLNCDDLSENTIKILIDAGANLDLQDNNGWTALMLACYRNNKNIIKMLVDAGAKLNIQNKSGNTAKK